MRFKRVYIEITNTCNLACSFCIQNQRQPRRMNIQEFTHVIQEVRSVTRHVYLHVLGEPPVSYTHLDVYKRQPYESKGNLCLRRNCRS